MPELPEVETISRGLRPLLEGRRIDDVRILDERLTLPQVPASVEQQLRGRHVVGVGRRGKYLLLELEDGQTAMHHLRMTGTFAPLEAGEEPPTYGRAWYQVGDTRIWYRDVRRFGTLLVLPGDQASAYLSARLGPEPLSDEFTVAALRAALRGRRAPIKAALLDQRVVAGLGNIYVDEALFQAGIAPSSEAGRIGTARLVRLRDAIVDRLQEAVDMRGSSLRDYRTVSGSAGSMQTRFRVYGRAGQLCHSCGATLRAGRFGGRSTTWCPRCQR